MNKIFVLEIKIVADNEIFCFFIASQLCCVNLVTVPCFLFLPRFLHIPI